MDSLESPNGLQLPNNHFRNDSHLDRLSWEYHNVSVTRVAGYGFGIAVSGGRDNPHFANGDPSIAVSDVLKGGPAEDRLQVNDRIISVNGVCLENVEYATAVHVLRDSGNTVTLVIKRRVPNLNSIESNQLHHSTYSGAVVNGHQQHVGGSGVGGSVSGTAANASSQQTIKLLLTKTSKKDDFGIVLGCRLFIKEISSKARDQLSLNGYSLLEGDIVTRIHNTNTNDSMSLKEAKKIIDGCKERLNLVIARDIPNVANNSGMQSPAYSHTAQVSNCSNTDDSFLVGGSSYSTQNLYVQPPTRPALSTVLDDKNNLSPRGRSRDPLMNASMLQLELSNTSQNISGHSKSRSGLADESNGKNSVAKGGDDFYGTRKQLYEDDPIQRSRQSAEPRFISFKKEGSVGIRLTGGNEAGIFVTAVQPGSPASLQGLTPGDKILKVNDMDMHEVTREEAVLFLLSLQDRVDLIVQHCKDDYETVVANQRGDSFHVKTHFHCTNPSKSEMPFKAGDVFRVVDTLHNGVVGSWQVLKVCRDQEMQRGVIPNKSRAEELATAQFNATKKEMSTSESRTSFFKRRRSNHRRSKSLSKENWDDVVFSDAISKFPAYERVILRHPGFVRPVVLFGPVADLARERLAKDFPDKFIVPLQGGDKGNAKNSIVRLSNIRDIMDRGKHALLDITPNAVDRLNYAQFYPIVIFLKSDTKHLIKQLRQGIPKSAHKSSKKLLEQCQKLDRMWSHIFSKTIVLTDVDTWYRKLRDAIDNLQSGAVWMSESKPVESLSDDFLFPMTTSRLSYASSPESDLELSPGPSTSLSLGNLPQLVKSSSDPSIATNQDNLERDREHSLADGVPPPYSNPFEHAIHQRKIERYGHSDESVNSIRQDPGGFDSLQSNSIEKNLASHYGMVPKLPPRIDRASKPAISSPLNEPQSPTSRHFLPPATPSSSSGGRRSKERQFASPSADVGAQDEFINRSSFLNQSTDKWGAGDNSLDRNNQNSLNRMQKMQSGPKNNESYESVSSVDSCNTTQISMQNLKLGPNAPDDLKSVPVASNRSFSLANDNTPISTHLHTRHLSTSNALSGGGPVKPIQMNDQYSKVMGPELRNNRPTHLPVDVTSPKKMPSHSVETKTDYGKYSRTNSVSQADYIKSPVNVQMGRPQNVVFKPVPPPKPKNYRAPVQMNGDQISERSPNNFYHPANAPQHSQNMPTSAISPIGKHGPGMHGYNHNMQNQMSPYGGSNNYSDTQPYTGHYMQRNPPINNIPSHYPPVERHALDLAGSREQRGSAFELYRKPQIANPAHHHNISGMEAHQASANLSNELNERQQCFNLSAMPPPPPTPPPKPAKLKFFKSPIAAIKNVFSLTKKPLHRQNSLIEARSKEHHHRSILRRQHSMLEHKSPHHHFEMLPPHSPEVMYRNSSSNRNPIGYHSGAIEGGIGVIGPDGRQYIMTDQENIYSDSTYQNLQTDSIYRNCDYMTYYDKDNLYANRALIQFERSVRSEHPEYGKRIVRRHSIADRSTSYRDEYRSGGVGVSSRSTSNGGVRVQRRHEHHHQQQHDDDIYQTRSGAFLMSQSSNYPKDQQRELSAEIPFHNRREMHLNHLYQSKEEMQQRIYQGRMEIEKASAEVSVTDFSHDQNCRANDAPPKDPVYQSRKELKERGFRTRTQLRDHIYQSRIEAMRTLAEPEYVSNKESTYSQPNNRPVFPDAQPNQPSDNNQSDQQKFGNNSNVTTNNNTTTPTDTVRTTSPVNYNVENIKSMPIPSHMTKRLPLPAPLSSIGDGGLPPPLPPSPSIDSNSNFRTSSETNYTSEVSLPSGPPNAQSTPYASEAILEAAQQHQQQSLASVQPSPLLLPPTREQTTKRGYFDENGGRLSDDNWNVSIDIPRGAIPPGKMQEIYFTVTDPRLSQNVSGPPLDMENGETMLSPLVMCGPQGLEFLVPVTLNIPHCAGRTTSLGLALKATDSEKHLHTNWDNIELPSYAASHTVSVKVDHFWTFL